ncbi:hypothetical protein [Nocardia brasiliensis]|uniref:hypothetical protein n=1 Tax=Nocardia brasiliensis TaxID=37326 RepID=UPI0018933C67|nr:hypothetical protein [Nocardia brasiliensis]MBF6125728.1 hypothetical protein [Nocardia brasiliensis]
MAISLLAAQFPELAPVWSALQADHGLVAHIVGRLDGLLDTAAAGGGPRIAAPFPAGPGTVYPPQQHSDGTAAFGGKADST